MLGSNNDKIDIKLTADTREATRSLREFERKVDRLGDMADQGRDRQNGFLSPKQVDMYRKIMRELENSYSKHKDNLEKVDKRYNDRSQREEFKKLKSLENELKKRQELLRNSEGGNKWGDVASPAVQEFHRIKHGEAKQHLGDYKESGEYKDALKDSIKLERELSVLTEAVGRLTIEMDRGNDQASRIDALHERTTDSKLLNSGTAQAVAATGAITGIGKYINYTTKGIGMLRSQEEQASNITQKLGGAYDGIRNADSVHRESIQSIGESNQFGLADTLSLQGILATGGISDVAKLNRDTHSAQEFGRAYAVDPNELASGGSLLQQMGALDEGQMDVLARLIGAQVAKNSMGGREEEATRATMALASSVSQGMAELTNTHLTSLVGLQTDVGQVDSLRGERGANLLANLDQGIKGADSNLDILLGKGTEFQGLAGMTELGYLKEEGLANPANLQRILQNAQSRFGDATGLMAENALKQFGMSQHEFRALKEAGILDRWKEGDFSSSEELESLGATDMAEHMQTWESSATRGVKNIEALRENTQSDHAKAAESLDKGAKGLFYGLPEPVRHTLIPAAAIGGAGMMLRGGGFLSGALDKGMKAYNKNIGGEGGWKNLTGGSKPPTPPGGAGSAGGNLLGSAGSKGIMTGVGTTAAKRVPVVGSLLGTGIDQVSNPEHDLGRSISKGVGGALGGALGFLGGGALGLGTGGLGFAAIGATTIGGGMAGEKAGDWIYSLFAGDEDKVAEKNREEAKKAEKLNSHSMSGQYGIYSNLSSYGSTSETSNVKSLNVSDLNIQDMAFADYFALNKSTDKSDMFSSRSSTYSMNSRLEGMESEHIVKVIVEGDIRGMDSGNQKEVKTSILDYFSGFFNSGSSVDLSVDQRRNV